MSELEHCERCHCAAPSWESADFAEWHELISDDGEYLGLVCVGCLADEQLLLVHLQAAYAPSG
jgi:hypothetical protein